MKGNEFILREERERGSREDRSKGSRLLQEKIEDESRKEMNP